MEQKNENVDILKKEIELVLDRNKDENYLKSLLTRALILEKIYKKKRLRETGALFFCKAVYQFSDGGFFFILHKPICLDDPLDELIV